MGTKILKDMFFRGLYKYYFVLYRNNNIHSSFIGGFLLLLVTSILDSRVISHLLPLTPNP